MTYSERFPEGLNKGVIAFTEAAMRVCKTEEIDKIIKWADKEQDTEQADFLRLLREEMAKTEKVGDMPPWIVVLDAMKSSNEILADIICYMVLSTKGKLEGDLLENELNKTIDDIKKEYNAMP